ncbi:MAG: erythromycin esterase-like enzyme [Acidimicrobiales bacterium]|nr:erythromycin esterase-like enzyme [Acidimicrobiales bacterium]
MSTTSSSADDLATEDIRARSLPLRSPADLDPLLERLGQQRVVLLGEASHGTSEYYGWRAELTKRLIVEQEFGFIAVEGDWPDCYEVNRWVKGRDTEHRTARELLAEFNRWPTWMWANEEIADFVDWLRGHNAASDDPVGFYGLDVYSLWESLRVITDYLLEHQPDDLDTLAEAWRCFEPYAEEPQRYAHATRLVPTSCEEPVIELLVEMQAAQKTDSADPEARFDARQNAEVVAGAERYYRTMAWADGRSWNVRDIHMADTLDRLLEHQGGGSRAVVWAHNTHVGDARATDMAAHGMVNLGQLARDCYGEDRVRLVGFAGHHGSVIAAYAWGAPMRQLPVPPAPDGTHEDLIHRAVADPALFVFGDDRSSPWLTQRRGHRAIGVVYDPQRDAVGNWVPTVMGGRYDALLSFDETNALHPLAEVRASETGERDTEPWAS